PHPGVFGPVQHRGSAALSGLPAVSRQGLRRLREPPGRKGLAPQRPAGDARHARAPRGRRAAPRGDRRPVNPHAPPQPAAGQLAGWPPAVFDAPVLRDLDEPSRRRICVAGKLLALPPGGVVYREGDVGHTFFVVASGEVALVATPRGHDQPTVVRTAQQGDTFGEEATLPGGLRRTTATAQSHTQVAEIPVAVYR